MVVEEANVSLGEFATDLVAALFDKLPWLSNFIKAVGIFAIIYAIYLVVKIIRDSRMRARVKDIQERIDVMDSKLDKLLRNSKKSANSGKGKKKK
ncbi:hypothetical protein CMI41_01545 [Candidatus Pacearchaeota archaeon]|nr:hypothetical protein [Candidatus Pacearchaeota archaeon]|tara:strand:+ start:1864 stop:2148 length:285 start_codon:yes stop_codon:yes gene_type:complete